MTQNTWKHTHIARAVAIVLLTVGFLSAVKVQAAGPSDAANEGGSLTGTWMIQVTRRDCATNAPLGPAFSSLVTFHGDGTLSESPSSAGFAPSQRGPGQGSWTPEPGHTYLQELIALVLFDTEPNLPGTPTFDPTKPVSPGFFAGWQTVTHTIQFTDVDQIASSGTNAFYKANGELYRSGCSTATGQRF